MLKRKAIRKIFITTFVLLILLSIYLIPSNITSNKSRNIVKYSKPRDISIYLVNESSQLTKVNFKVKNEDLNTTIKDIINKLTIGGDSTVPDGLYGLIPKNIELIDVNVDENIAYLNFSKGFLDIDHQEIEKIVESISFSILELEGVNGVVIYVEGDNISRLFPKNIPDIITKEYGINKRIELKNFIDISKIVIYYISNIDDNTYYVPITKYVNDKREKVKIIIDELSSNYIFEPNLISLLDKNIELISYEIKNDSMILNFNNSIFMDKDSILEEVVYSISYSVFSSYDNVQEVVFKVGEKEICKKNVKNVE